MWHLSTLYSIHNRTHCFSILRKRNKLKIHTHTTHIYMYKHIYTCEYTTHTCVHISKHTHHAHTQSTLTYLHTYTVWKITFIRGNNACPSESILLLADHVRSKLLGSQVRINVSVKPELLWFMPFNLCVHFVH